MAPGDRRRGITLRLAADQRRLNASAALARGLSLPDYILSLCLAAARRDLEARGVILLDGESYERVQAITERPARVNPWLARLYAARDRYRIAVADGLDDRIWPQP